MLSENQKEGGKETTNEEEVMQGIRRGKEVNDGIANQNYLSLNFLSDISVPSSCNMFILGSDIGPDPSEPICALL